MPRASAATLGGLLYEVGIYLLEEGEDPNQAVLVKQPITGLPIATNLTSLAYGQGVGHTLLETGKRYAIRVQVTDPSGKNTYLNNGFIQVVSFYYGQPCLPPPTPLVTKVTTKTFSLEWKKQPAAQWYEVSFRHNEQVPWELQTAYFTNATLPKIENHDEHYRFKVRSVCSGNRLSQWSDEAQVLPQKNTNLPKKANPSVATLPPTTTSLDDLLNPFDIMVSTGGQTDEEIKEEYDKIRSIKATTDRCGAAIVNEVGCEPVNYDYSGTETFSFAPEKLMYLNGYEILITAGNATQGEGLLYYPYIAGRLAVQWNGLTVVKGPEGEDYGCITSGEAIVQGSDDTVLQDDLKRQILALLNQGPGSFTGKFGEALEAAKNNALEIIAVINVGGVPTNEQLGKFKGACKAVKIGIDAWTLLIRSQAGENPSNEVTDLIAAITTQATLFEQLANCTSTPTNSTNGGQNTAKKFPLTFLTCNYSATEPATNATKTEINNAKEIFKAPPTPITTCITKIADLKAAGEITSNTFVCPDGGTILLNDTDEIQSYNYDASLFPNGSLLGFKRNGKNYVARIRITQPTTFTGYVDRDTWEANNNPPNPSFNSSQPTTTDGWIIERIANQLNTFATTYTTAYTKGITQASLNYIRLSIPPVSQCDIKSGKTDSPPKNGYSNNLEDLKSKLASYSLGDVVFKVTDKDGKISYATKDRTYTPSEIYTPQSNTTIFEIKEDANGKVDVSGTFKPDGRCATCAGAAQTALNAALEDIKAKHGGKIDPSKNAIESQTILQGTGGGEGIVYTNMSLAEMLSAVAKGYNSILDNAKVPEEMWKTGKTFPVRDETAVISGAIDGVANELTDKAQLVGLGLTIIAHPIETGKKLVNFMATMDWEKAKDAALKLGQGLINYDAEEFELGGKYALHATGKVGGSLAMNGTMLLAIVTDVPNALKKSSGFFESWIVDLSKIRKINGRFPINSQLFAGKKFSFDVNANPKYVGGVKAAEKVRLDALHLKYPNGVDFDEFGFARFEPYTEKVMKNGVEVEAKVTIQTAGNRNSDIAAANVEMGINTAYLQANNLTWHHVEDTKTMILIKSDLHDAVKHTGGIAVFKNDINLDE